eukprot:gnl/Hemi2/5877_TR2034_c0_g4_i1.p2 gnl/Hemi2/5877_TR2034_c0_g4~~gnl/Hemi2/5877_TR2034_c0_g4_i1.p2  ORF type:complete len:100 (-),score=8.22 gnl/Hemi2/5877_TR2034_c0_g4_i1:136-435(-)
MQQSCAPLRPAIDSRLRLLERGTSREGSVWAVGVSGRVHPLNARNAVAVALAALEGYSNELPSGQQSAKKVAEQLARWCRQPVSTPDPETLPTPPAALL